MFRFEHFSQGFAWRDTVAVVDRIAAMPVGTDGMPPLLTFVVRVAAEVSGHLAAELDEWVDVAAGVLGVDPTTVRALRGNGRGLPIWGGVPARHLAFTGREGHLLDLHRALERRSKASVLSRARHGSGGVGKTQLAAEFAYRYASHYDVVWWIPAEQRSIVLRSLHQLGQHLGTPATADLQQSANLVLEELAGSQLRWLLVYDNANEPEELARLIPARGGHVILTSRDQTWSAVWDPVEVDVFTRAESVELIRRRRETVTATNANRLAARLGDLPLALDQAVSCQIAAEMSVDEYLVEFDRHSPAPSAGPHRATLVALVRLTMQRLRAYAPAVAELLELFAFLGAEPISGGFLRRGREARVSAALGRALRDQMAWDRAIRDLRRYGMARVDPYQRIQMHRLFQAVLRDEIKGAPARRARTNVQHLLASANPGYPLDESTWPLHAEVGPHIGPAGLIDSDLLDARRVVLDQVRYLNMIGDLEGCRRLGDAVVDAWSKVEGVQGLGPNGDLTLRASLYLSITLRHLGFNERARSLSENALERFRDNPEYGPDHEHTLYAASVVSPTLRVAGLYREALALDLDNVARHRRILGDEDEVTVNERGNLAVNLRMLGDFEAAYAMDVETVGVWRQIVGENDHRLLFAQANLARDLYGLGRYGEALRILRAILPPFRRQLGVRHPYVMLAARTLAIVLRKAGLYDEALAVAAGHDRDCGLRYGSQHERALAAAMTYANTLRVVGDLAEAQRRTAEVVDRSGPAFGADHPLALAAMANHAIVLRQVGELTQARELNERTYARMRDALGPEHGDTLCAAGNLASDLALAGEWEAARRLSTETLEISQRARGQPHPYTLACAVNVAIDLMTTAPAERGRAGLDDAVAALSDALGADHPEVVAARDGQRADFDIEPSPT